MVSHPYSIYIWQPPLSSTGPGHWFEPVQCYTQEYGLYVASLIHQDSRSVIKVVRYGINILCLPDEHAVELVEKQIAKQKQHDWRENGEEEEERRDPEHHRKLVRSATGANAYQPGSPGILREWHWRALVEAWKSKPAGVKSEYGEDYGHISWNTWLRLRDYKTGPLIEEYSTSGKYLAHVGYTEQIHWLKLSALGEQFYRQNWQRYRELYPEVDP